MTQFAFQIEQADQKLTVHAKGVALVTELALPAISPALPAADRWVLREVVERPMNLAGAEGSLTEYRYETPAAVLYWQVWVSLCGKLTALRQRLMYRGSEPAELVALHPLCCRGHEGLLLDGASAGDWELVAQARYKNGIPTSVRPGLFDGDYAQNVARASEQGYINQADGTARQIEMDSFGVLKNRCLSEGTRLLVGYLSQKGHLARLTLRTDVERQELELFQAECEFDHVVLPRGGERTSQWVLLMAGDDEHELIAVFADLVGAYHHVEPPAERPPSVLCSWYYYGPHFAEADFDEDLAYLKKDRLPLDVFLIDECWDMHWGDWWGNELWPSGMKRAADKIRALGYRPGIWTCPYLVKADAERAFSYPDALLRLEDGTLHEFAMDGPNYVLDPTYPGVCDHIETLYRRLTEDWGFTYHKLDFLRSVFVDPRVRFYDRSATRLEAYERGLQAVRRGIGPEAYLSVCGGHYGGSLGLANSQRSGSDVSGMWDNPPALPKIKQNIYRTWMSRLWHVDPDAMMVRRRTMPINDTRHGVLSLGLWNDDEARTIALNQYVGGGIVCFTEKFCELDADRKALYRHVIPSVNSPSLPLDYFAPECPSQLLTPIQPVCAALEPWVTVALFNWNDERTDLHLTLDEAVCQRITEKFLAYEFWSQRLLGVFSSGETLTIPNVAAHSNALVKLLPWHEQPTFVATDLHFSMGGVEMAEVQADANSVSGRIETCWNYPVQVFVAFPSREGPMLKSATLPVGQTEFTIHA